MNLFDRYKIEKTLGHGGFGETFLAKDTRMPSQRLVVIKKLKPINQLNVDDQIIKDSFRKEAAVLEKLGESHPNIPKLYEYFEYESEFYIIQEYIEGKTLAEISPVSSEKAFSILCSILETLQYVHDNKIIHRDIKPENIIIRDADQQPILIDFGAVKDSMGKVKLNSGSTVGSKIIGTRGYMAPEQSQGYPIFSSDLYSLGRTMIFALTGKIPIADEIEINPLTGELEWTKYVSEIDDKLAYVINKANQLSPNLRYPTAKEMRQDLMLNSQIKTKVLNLNSQKKSANNSQEIPDITILSSKPHNKNIKTSFSFVFPQSPDNIWKLLIAGGASCTIVAISIFTGFQWAIKNNTENLIAESETYYQNQKHEDCFNTVKKAINESKQLFIFDKNNLFNRAIDLENKCQVAYAKKLLANA